MKIVFDCRWHKKSGIGTFADNVLAKMLKTENVFLLLGFDSLPEEFNGTSAKVTCLPCAVPAFSLKEMFSFPRELSKIINQYDVYFTTATFLLE